MEVKPIDAEFLTEWLSEKKARRVSILKPLRGDKFKLIKMCAENASEALKEEK